MPTTAERMERVAELMAEAMDELSTAALTPAADSKEEAQSIVVSWVRIAEKERVSREYREELEGRMLDIADTFRYQESLS
jgi:hypothetical protein